jgi:hypothetical protein
MGLHEGRRRGGEPGLIGESQIGRVPPGTAAYAVRVLEGCEEFVPQEGITISPERIPLPRVELVDRFVDL